MSSPAKSEEMQKESAVSQDINDKLSEKIDIENGKPAAPAMPSFPDGGLKAWLVVVGCWCCSFASFGIVNSFGIYENYYLETFLQGYSPSTVAWIGSIQAFTQFSATLLSGPILDRYGPSVIIWPASLVIVVAMMLTSLCHEFYQFLLCQGIFLGIGTGFIFAPSLAVIGQYFFKKRAMAMAFASTGSPIGAIIYPVILTNLLPSVGFGWAQRVCAFVTLFLLAVAVILIRPTGMKRKNKFILLGAFKKPMYSLQVAALFMIVLGFWTPYFYLAEYGLDYGMSPELANYLFAIINAGSFVGRVVSGSIAQKVGQFNVAVAASFISSILLFCWLAATTSGGVIVISLLFGTSSGTIIAMMMPTIAFTADHPSNIGSYIGQATFIIGFAGLAGTPIVGAMISRYDSFTPGIAFSATSIMIGAILFTFARYSFAKDKLVA